MSTSALDKITCCRLRAVCGSSFFFQAEDGIRDSSVTGVQTCALPISGPCRKGLLQVVNLPEEDPYDKARVAVAAEALQQFLRHNGYFDSTIQTDSQIEIGRASCRERV